jgi:AraC-like DNA-binding protein
MEVPKVNASEEIIMSCIEEKFYQAEIVVSYHAIVKVISGEMKVVQANATGVYGTGDILFFARNQPATIIKYPVDGIPYQAMAIHLMPERLKQYYTINDVASGPAYAPKIQLLDQHPLLESLFASLSPYFSLTDKLPDNIATGKVDEAISILRHLDRGIDSILANFEAPGKIDLANFMEKNYMFNVPLEKFGYLTGRSLTTFQRDFKKVFNTTPQKWLTKKRLELAHYQIVEKQQRPSDVYFEVGFENLSHFSFAFKKQFGYNPTSAMPLL